MTEDKKTTYAIHASLRITANVEGSYRTGEVVNTTRQNETQELDAIPAAAFHAAKEAVQGALIGMGTNPARIGLSLPGMLEEPEALPEGEPQPELPEGWEQTVLDAVTLLGTYGHEGTAQALETLYTALGGTDPLDSGEIPPERREGAQEPDEDTQVPPAPEPEADGTQGQPDHYGDPDAG